MGYRRVDVGISLGSGPPLGRPRAMVRLGRTFGASSGWLVDHYTGVFPRSLWKSDFTWAARRRGAPDAFFDWQVLAGHLGDRMGRMQLGVGVTEAVRRHPVTLAQAALTLSHVTRRPPILGIGSGEAENVTPYGLSFERPVARMDEALRVIRLLLEAEEPVSFQGEFFELDQARLELGPGQGGTPEIWVAAHGPRTLGIAGRHGDGWYPGVPLSPKEYAASLATVRAAATEEGRDPDRIVPSLYGLYLVGKTDADVKRQSEHRAVRFLALLAPDRVWQSVGLEHPLGVGFGGMSDFLPAAYPVDRLEAAIDQVPPEFLAHQMIAGTPDAVVERIRRLADSGLRHVVLRPASPLVSRKAMRFTVRTLPRIIRHLRTGEG